MKVEQWIEEWCNIFPDVNVNGYNIRSDVKYCLGKMKKFVKSNPQFTKEQIFEATKNYIADKKAENFQYTKQSTYFIDKLGQPSLLLAYCKRLVQPQKEVIIEEYNPINDFI